MSDIRKEHKKEFSGSGRIGLAVMRLQPPHRGHMNLINRMLQDCDTAIIGFGSAQLSGVARHPFTYEQRVEMVQTVFGDHFQPLPLTDINPDATDDEWMDHILAAIRAHNLPAPTDYYTGSPADAQYYTGYFATIETPAHDIGMTRSYHGAGNDRRLHIIDRVLSTLPPAEELRTLIEKRDPAWHHYVPERLIGYIEAHYPAALRTPK